MSELNYIPINLPSRGKIKDIPSIIHAKPLNLHAIKMIASISTDDEATVEQAITDVINYLTKEKIDASEFTLSDRTYILIVLRINGWSEWYDVPWTCPACNSKITNSPIDLSKANIVPISEEYNEPAELTLKNGDKIYIRLPRGKDIIRAHQLAKDPNDIAIYQICSTISAINGESKSIEEIYQYVDNNLTAWDFSLIRSFYDEYSYGYDGKAKVTCPKCKKEVEISVPFRADTFFTYNVTKDDLKNAIRFKQIS